MSTQRWRGGQPGAIQSRRRAVVIVGVLLYPGPGALMFTSGGLSATFFPRKTSWGSIGADNKKTVETGLNSSVSRTALCVCASVVLLYATGWGSTCPKNKAERSEWTGMVAIRVVAIRRLNERVLGPPSIIVYGTRGGADSRSIPLPALAHLTCRDVSVLGGQRYLYCCCCGGGNSETEDMLVVTRDRYG